MQEEEATSAGSNLTYILKLRVVCCEHFTRRGGQTLPRALGLALKQRGRGRKGRWGGRSKSNVPRLSARRYLGVVRLATRSAKSASAPARRLDGDVEGDEASNKWAG